MELPLDGALQFLDQIAEIQHEIDQANDKEYNVKLKLRDEGRDKMRWDDENGCLRHPYVTRAQELLFQERSQLVKLLPKFWATALFADDMLVSYMNEEERKVFEYLKSMDVFYHGNAKSGYEIQLNMDENNPYFHNLTLTKTFRFSRKGLCSERGTEISWKKKGKNIKDSAEKGGTQSHTGIPSFFKWFMEDSEMLRDLVAEEIVHQFWHNAHMYYFIGTDRLRAGEGVQMLTEKKRARQKSKGYRKTPEVDIPRTLSKLRTISDKFQMAKHEAAKERYAMQVEHNLVLLKGEREAHKECESLRRRLYSRRNEIIKNIHHFWLIAFLSHYALRHLLSKEDLKILKFLNSVNVEETEDEEDVMSGYTITLNFDKNPYFENDSLTISYTKLTDDQLKEYRDGEVNICVSNIEWIDGMDITPRNQRVFTDPDRSFFTWFSGLGCVAMEPYDEVANLIRNDLWPNAGKYFVNGNLNDDKEVDIVGIHRIEIRISRLPAFYL